MANIAALRKKANAARDELYKAEAKERNKINAKLIGNCFKYHNAGGGCDTRWWLYLKVLKIDDGNLRCFSFEELPNGNINIEPNHFIYAGGDRLGVGNGYTLVPNSEFDAVWARLRSKIATFLS